MPRRAMRCSLALAVLMGVIASQARAQQPRGAVDIGVALGPDGAAQVTEEYTVVPGPHAVELRLIERPCSRVTDLRLERAGVAVAFITARNGPWFIFRDTSSVVRTDSLLLTVRYEVRATGARLDLPMAYLTVPIPQRDGQREGSVRLLVRLGDSSSRVVFPRMAREGSTGWSARYVAVPSFVSVAPGEGTSAPCSDGVVTTGDGGLTWRFLTLLGIMVAWVPLYLAWARRSADGAE